MARNERLLKATPERVFDVLMDTGAYADWVVGAHSIRATDANWPAIGSRFHHRVGFGLLRLKDHTEVVERDPPRRLVLHARGRPLGTAIVTMTLESREGGTLVTMTETAGDLLSHIGLNPATDWMVHLRNIEALRRFARIVETGVVKS